MLKIYVARHGQNEDNANGILNGHRDMPLTPIGVRQGYELADGIKKAGITFDVVYTSPLVRAKRTAEIVCETLGLDGPQVLPELIERDFGVMTGQPAARIEELCAPDIVKAEKVTYFLCPEGAETFPMLIDRARRVLADIRDAHADESVLLSTHGDFGKMLYAAFYRVAWQGMLTMFHFGNCELLLLAPDADPDEPHVVRVEQYN